MLYGSYSFQCTFRSPAQLPAYKGSTFRGAFGWALKSVVCALRRQQCDTCLLRSNCLYPLVFETRMSIAPHPESHVVPPPHPFVIEPPDSEQTRYDKGDRFDFNLLLFGPVNDQVPYFIYAFEKMGGIGTGRGADGGRGRFVLNKVKAGNRILYLGREGKLRNIPARRELTLKAPRPGKPGEQTLPLFFDTPLRIKSDGRLSRKLPFHILVRAMLRRASGLLAFYGEGEPDIDYRGLVKRAAEVRIESDNLSWQDWRRYSTRQKQAMMIGGLAGSITYSGDLAEFLPLIEFCSKVHIGKQTAFGLGKFHVEPGR
ncbi:MAG: CRISPR system precrRNA processing endoribonuclease RAMP protein Cas6 [Desulfobacterales bacterium]|nr:CRISPR system precrRNA processing endoribonuclease RAMP protein Cas6 [Desulfobacterales bacterium]